jgi:hypothetical protein
MIQDTVRLEVDGASKTSRDWAALSCLRLQRRLDLDPARFGALLQRQNQFEHAVTIRRLHVLRSISI